MSRRPLNFLPLAVKFITALTGYRCTRPRRARLYKTCVIYKLPYGIKEDAGLYGDADVSRKMSHVSLDTFYCLGVPRLLRVISSKRDKGGKAVKCWGKCCGKIFKKWSLESIQPKLCSQRCNEKSRSFNFIVITFYFLLSILQAHIDQSFILFAFRAQYLTKPLPHCK